MYKYLENERAENLYFFFVRYHCICMIQIFFQTHREQISKKFVFFILYDIIAFARFKFRFKHTENKSTENLFFLFRTLLNVAFAQFIISLKHIENKSKKHCFFCFIHYRTLHSHKSSFVSNTSRII